MGLRVAVLGAGANGAALGAALTRAGRDVVLIDQWAANVEAMQAGGVIVDRPDGTTEVTPVRAHHLSDVATFTEPFDVVLVSVKAYDTSWATQLIGPALDDHGVVVGVQNGLTMAPMAAVAGEHRTIGCVIEVAASMFEPGRVRQQVPMWFAVGALEGGPRHRVSEIVELLSAAGTATESTDILSAKWMKLVANASELVTSALLDLPLARAIEVPGMFDVMRSAGEEAARVAVAAGRSMVPVFGMTDAGVDSPEMYARRLLQGVLDGYTLPDTLTTVLQDWRKGRRAEIQEINGEVVRAGQRYGVETPANSRVLELAQRVEAGRVAAGLDNAAYLTGA